MASNDADKNRTTGNRFDPRSSSGYLPWFVGAIVLAGALFAFMGDSIMAPMDTPTNTNIPQTTTPAPATK
jgi:hypothetical protein